MERKRKFLRDLAVAAVLAGGVLATKEVVKALPKFEYAKS